jgi:hypothetical protein
MKKWLFFFFSFAMLILVSFTTYVYMYRAEFLSNALTKLYGTPVRVAKVHLSKRGLKLQQITLFNPPEYIQQPAATAETIDIKMAPDELIAAIFGYRPVKIRKIAIHDPHFSIILQNGSPHDNNWTKIIRALRKNTSTTKLGRKVNVSEFVLNDVSVEIRKRPKSKANSRLPEIPQLDLDASTLPRDTPLEQLIYLTTVRALTELTKKIDQPTLIEIG